MYFDRYVRDIAAHRDEIREVFAPKFIETLQPDGKRLPVEEIHCQVLAGSTWPATTHPDEDRPQRSVLVWHRQELQAVPRPVRAG